MGRWLLGVLFVPLLVVLALASIVVRSQNDRYNEVVNASELASLAIRVNELDKALGEEALVATDVISDPSLWRDFQLTHAQETDRRLASLEEKVTDDNSDLANAVQHTRTVLSYREDILNGLVTPLQLIDRYGEPRDELLDVLRRSELQGEVARLTALIEARSAHLDERFSSQLVLRYGSWETGQYSNTTTAIAIQSDRVNAANNSGVAAVEVTEPLLTQFRQELMAGRGIPAMSAAEYAAASDRWLATLNQAIEAETDSLELQLQTGADNARRDRLITVLGVLLGTAVAFLAAGVISYRIVNRLQRLAIFAGRVAIGERDLGRVSDDVSGNDELADLAGVIDEMIDEVRQRDKRLALQARTDDLTGLLNRRAILGQWRRLVTENEGRGFALAVDLDGFKAVNDQYGHHTGDQVLVAVAGRLRSAIGQRKAAAGRVGGDEFLIVVGLAAEEGEVIDDMASTLLDLLQQPFQVGGKEVILNASIGLVERRSGASATSLLHEADIAMYESKSAGGGVVHKADESLRRRSAEVDAERSAVRAAIDNEDFVGGFQPIIAPNGGLLGFEVLARWKRSKSVLLTPDAFIDSIAHERLFPKLDRLMLQRACEALALWKLENRPHFLLSVNISTEFLERGDFVESVLSEVDSRGVNREHLMLEITESSVMHDAFDSSRKLAELRKAGFSIAVDDYGTGYSSLSYVQRLPIDFVKLDRQFVDRVDENETSQAIARSVLTLAGDLNVNCIVEGIERPEEHEWFVENGADFLQGYLHGRPGSESDARALLHNERSNALMQERV